VAIVITSAQVVVSNPGEVTTYMVFFNDPQLQAEATSFLYFFQLVLDPESECNGSFVISGSFAWQAMWDHSGCAHYEDDFVRILIRRDGYEDLLLEVPAVGPYIGP
jgi:hypothetical protein